MTLDPSTKSLVTVAFLTERLWRFGKAGEKPVSELLRFHPNGTITGYKSPNEVLWGLEGGVVVLKKADGHITTRFNSVSREGNNIQLRGQFLDNVQAAIILQLEAMSWEERPLGVIPTSEYLARYVRSHGWEIGAHTYGDLKIFSSAEANLSIGKFTSIAEGCSVALGNHRTDFGSSYPFSTLRKVWPSAPQVKDHSTKGNVSIGSDVWIGANVFIASGVTIGDGSRYRCS